MPACFATLLRPGTPINREQAGALRPSGETSAPGEENCRCQNQFGIDDRGGVGFEMKQYTKINLSNSSQLNHKTICQLKRSINRQFNASMSATSSS
jgi:hypothetical protein